jgi:hypothetical protein
MRRLPPCPRPLHLLLFLLLLPAMGAQTRTLTCAWQAMTFSMPNWPTGLPMQLQLQHQTGARARSGGGGLQASMLMRARARRGASVRPRSDAASMPDARRAAQRQLLL